MYSYIYVIATSYRNFKESDPAEVCFLFKLSLNCGVMERDRRRRLTSACDLFNKADPVLLVYTVKPYDISIRSTALEGVCTLELSVLTLRIRCFLLLLGRAVAPLPHTNPPTRTDE